MANIQMDEMAKTKSELLNHVKYRKLRYFGHAMRLPYDIIKTSVMVDGYILIFSKQTFILVFFSFHTLKLAINNRYACRFKNRNDV